MRFYKKLKIYVNNYIQKTKTNKNTFSINLI